MWLSGGKRSEYIDAVWEMYRASYAAIGMHLKSESDLLDYDQWEVYLESGKPVAFCVFKATPFGLKVGLLGTDGSPAGKSAVKSKVKARAAQDGVYCEVSHAVERLLAGLHVVCAIHVPKVLNKVVVPTPDGVKYERKLEGVGMVTKKMVGAPKGVPHGAENSCPIPENPGKPLGPSDVKLSAEKLAAEHRWEAAEHASCDLDLD